ncbi:MAG: helix-turn-helix transcriptional regulator [Polyangiaceae bacterium]
MKRSLRGARTNARSGGQRRTVSLRGPQAELDRSGKLRVSSPALLKVLAAHELDQEVLRVLSRRPGRELKRAMRAAEKGQAQTFHLRIRRPPVRRLTFTVRLLAGRVVLTLAHLSVGPERTRPNGYEVLSTELNFGKLVAVHAAGRRLPTVGLRCYASFAEREEPCVGCPAVELRGGRRQATGVLSGQRPLWVMHAQKLSKTRALVCGVPLDESQVSRVVRERLHRTVKEAKLSRREQDVLDVLLLGRSMEEIAELLGITVRTARFHLSNILNKVGADSRADLVRLLL